MFLLLASNLLFPFVIGEPLTYGWLIAEHKWIPHRDFVDQHTQGLPLLIAGLTFLTKDALLASRMVFLLFPILTAGLLAWAARWMFADRRAAILAPLIFTAWYVMWAKNTAWFHDPIVFLAPLSILLLLHPRLQEQLLQSGASGLAFGTALLFKQTAIVFLPILLLVILRSRNRLGIVVFLAAVCIPILLYLTFFAVNDSFTTMIQQAVVEARILQTYNQAYFGLYIAPPKVSTLLQLSFVLILIPATIMMVKQQGRKFSMLILILSAIAAMTFSYPQLTLQHASLATPFLALLATGFLLKKTLTAGGAATGPAAVVLFILFLTLLPQLPRAMTFLQKGSPQTSTYTQVVGEIQRLMDPNEKIVICCGEPRYYFDSQRIPATKYLFFSELAGALDWDRKMTEELNTNRPQHIVYSPTYFDISQNDPAIYSEAFAEKKKTASAFLPIFEEELNRSYQPIATISPTIHVLRRTR
ncbi:MAG: hypothetical protein Q8R11_01660 [bacterium]|nr:hypothetical protein [bacterium]